MNKQLKTMNTRKLSKIKDKLSEIQLEYEEKILSIEEELRKYIDFDFSMAYSSDGWIMVFEFEDAEYTGYGHNSPVNFFIQHIIENGKVSKEDALKLSI